MVVACRREIIEHTTRKLRENGIDPGTSEKRPLRRGDRSARTASLKREPKRRRSQQGTLPPPLIREEIVNAPLRHAEVLLPHNIEAEQALLGAILVNNDALDRVLRFLEPAHFFEPIHQEIYDVVRTLITTGKVATPVTLKTFLPPDIDIAGLALGQYLARLAAEATTIINAVDYGRTIRDLSARRAIIRAAESALSVAFAAPPEMDPAAIAGELIDECDAIVTARSTSNTPRVSIERAANEAVERMTCALQRHGGVGGISWGLDALDQKTDGLQREELTIVAGRPGMGKTAISLGSGLKMALRGHTVLYFSLEMMGAALANRCLADLLFGTKNEISYWMVTRGNLSDLQAEAVVDKARELRGCPLEIEQQAGLNVSQIAARTRKHGAALERQGKRLDVVIIDHLGLVQPSNRYAGNRTHEIEETTGALKALAKELNVAVVALCQLNRAVEGREDKRPTMADLRDSGAIEQDADLIILLFREEYYLTRSSSKPSNEDVRVARLAQVRNRLELIIGKSRNGPTPTVPVFFNASCNAVRDLPERRQ
jgi:replicative DNA helicase